MSVAIIPVGLIAIRCIFELYPISNVHHSSVLLLKERRKKRRKKRETGRKSLFPFAGKSTSVFFCILSLLLPLLLLLLAFWLFLVVFSVRSTLSLICHGVWSNSTPRQICEQQTATIVTKKKSRFWLFLVRINNIKRMWNASRLWQ